MSTRETSTPDNFYEDDTRADSYARLEFPGTYYLAFRDLPALFEEHVQGGRAMDFGCGAGRSTRFLKQLGFDPVVGVDISAPMLRRARERDPEGDYRLVPDGDLSSLRGESFDLVLAAFPFDNVAARTHKLRLFAALRDRLAPDGRLVNVVSSERLYVNEWASFTSQQFDGNRDARPGDVVHLIMLDVPDRRPVDDIFFPDESYREVYREAGLEPIATHRPLGRESEPHEWVSETHTAPWTIYVLGRSGRRT